VLAGRPIVTRVGTADVLAEARRSGEALIVDLAHIDGGWEGAPPTLVAFLERYDRPRDCAEVRWAVRATNCARPNERPRSLLVRRGFTITRDPVLGD